MVDCMLPADVHEPSDIDRAYVVAARGRFYRMRWNAVMLEPGLGTAWTFTTVPIGTEVATATASGLPTMTLAPPLRFPDGTMIPRTGIIVRVRGEETRWIPSVAIIADRRGARLAHGWIPMIDLVALPQSLIAANALRYDIAVQRCAQDAERRAAEADQRAAIAAGLDVRSILTAPSTTNDATAEDATRDILTRGTLLIRPDGSKATGDEVVATQRSGMAVAILGTLGVVGVLGLIAWAMSGESR